MNSLKAEVTNKEIPPFDRLKRLFEILRSEKGCAWDRKQDHQSLLPYLIEETYEVVEVIRSEEYDSLKEELGDLLVQVVFHAQLAKERGEFDIDDAVENTITKLVDRHPHVFGEQRELTPKQVRDQWEMIKTNSGEKDSVLGGLPASMPALTMAFRVGEKAGGVGFDWYRAEEVLDKIEEEIGEIRKELADATRLDKNRLSEEIGDFLFASASFARKLEIEPETALKKALTKFRERFGRLEKRVKESGRTFENYTLEELESIWQEIKTEQ